MYRKIIIILVSVFFSIFGVITQALVIFLVLIIFLILNIKLLPYTFKSLNDMEMLSIMTSMITIYCGLFFVSHLPEVYNSDDASVREADNGLRLNKGSEIFFFSVIILWNIAFVIYWITKMLQEARNTVRSKLERIYLWICLWGNRNKLEKQKKEQEIRDNNDILKEKFDLFLEGIKDLHTTGRIVLNDTNIEKVGLYLNPERFVKNVMCYEEPSEDEIRSKYPYYIIIL